MGLGRYKIDLTIIISLLLLGVLLALIIKDKRQEKEVILSPSITAPSLESNPNLELVDKPSLPMDTSSMALQAVSLPPPPTPAPEITASEIAKPIATIEKPQRDKKPIEITPLQAAIEPNLDMPIKAEAVKTPETKTVFIEPLAIKSAVKPPLKASFPKKTVPSLNDLIGFTSPKKPEMTDKKEAKEDIDIALFQQKKATEVKTPTSQQLIQEGRPLLKKMELNMDQGQTPSIDLAWPDNPMKMEALYQELNRCYGMKSLIMVDNGFYDGTYDDIREFTPNLDRYSAFLRRVHGAMPAKESQLYQANRANNAQLVRLFPRNMDALLLGGLANIFGADFIAGTIHGRYHLDAQNRLFIVDLSFDGTASTQKIALSGAQSCLPILKMSQ